MNPQREAILGKVTRLKVLLVARATGELADDVEFQNIRRELMDDISTNSRLPRFIRSCRNLSEFWAIIKLESPTYHGRREFLRREFDPLLTALESEEGSPMDGAVGGILAQVDSEHVKVAWQKALDRRTNDPEGAITAARALVETVCKHILDTSGIAYGESDDLPQLYRAVSRTLNLAPSQHSEQIVKQTLGGCQTVVEGIGALRNKDGDAHGKGKAGAKPAPRHAGLAVNLAGTMACFLIETWETRQGSLR